MVIHWKLLNNRFICYDFVNGCIKSKTCNIPIGIFDNNGTFTPTENFQLQNKQLHTWNVEIFLKLSMDLKDIYFDNDSDYLAVDNIEAPGCGFLFDESFEDYLEELVLTNDPRKNKFYMIDGTYIYDNRIVVITNTNFNDIFKLSFYCKKLTISPFRLNREQSPYQLLKNYIYFIVPRILQQTPEQINISGGLIRFKESGFHKHLYEYDIVAFYPNIIMKYLDENEPIRLLMTPLINDSLKCLRLFVYGMLGSRYSVLYSPRTMDKITTIGRSIVEKYKHRAAIIATDAIFMTYPIIPDFGGLPYKTIVHDDVFIISASQYFTSSKYKGFPKNDLSHTIHVLLKDLLNGTEYNTTPLALLGFMQSLKTFPLLPIPLKNGQQITTIIKSVDPTTVDKFLYVIKYRRAIYQVCQHKSIEKIDYDAFKVVYNYFMY
jgi:hypothetical protein